eukprot:COSAG01_NODE_1872_length_9006_cov_523.219153_4_plen_685_part_00
MANEIPAVVLSEVLAEKIRGRRVTAAVFTTFSFDPGFFELHILPGLFDFPFSQVEKVKRIQLDYQIQGVDDISVYYDASAISQDALPAQLDFRRIGVRVGQGIFHPKLVLLLVENTELDDESGEEEVVSHSLVVGTLSANLTRAGWWENVEAGHFETIDDKDHSDEVISFRRDLLRLTKYILKLAPHEPQVAMNRIRDYLKKRTNTQTRQNVSSVGQHFTRLFFGQKKFSEWLSELRIGGDDWNLEIVSPYFDAGHTGTLEALVDVVEPVKTRVFLPTKADGSGLVSKALFESIKSLEGVAWAKPPLEVTRAGNRKTANEALPRFVHAKIYRLWQKSGKQIIIVGSLNMTSPAHSRLKAGNLEASFLVDVSDAGYPRRWWLRPIESEPDEFEENNPEVDSECDSVFLDLAFRFDWSERVFSYYLVEEAAQFKVCEGNGVEVVDVAKPITNKWVKLSVDISEQVEKLLASTSFVTIKHAKGEWRAMVREEGLSHRPSLMSQLSPEEILEYWSLLSDAQKEAFITEKLAAEGTLDLQGLSVKTQRYQSQNTLFDQFSGIYHAFERLVKHVSECIEKGRDKEAETRLLGAKYDSLPEFLTKILEQNDDAVMRYVIFLCAKQAVDRIRDQYASFWDDRPKQRAQLEKLLDNCDQLGLKVELPEAERKEFLEWYQAMFLQMIEQPEAVS